jgi:Flp pilus assembly pilin Flp
MEASAMTTFMRLIRDDAGGTTIHFAIIAIVVVVVGLATASSISANLRAH